MDKHIESIIEKPLDDSEIKSYLGEKTKIYTYPELKKFKNIEDLLPLPFDYCIILYLDNPNEGHWVSLLRYDPYIEFFCSYGTEPDGSLKWIDDKKRKELNCEIPYLTNMLNKTKKNVIYNPIKYQDDSNNKFEINTCGRHCSYRVLQAINNKTLEDYYDFIKNIKNKTGDSYDEIVSRLITK
jgi:hypothetical protein